MVEAVHPRPVLTAGEVLDDPSASFALKQVLRAWADRDIVDAANDAAVLQLVCQGAVLARLEGGTP